MTQNGISFTSLVVRLSIYTVSSILVLDDTITVGMLTVILSFYEQLTFNIQKLSSRYLDLENRISYIEKIHKFFQTSTEETWNGKDELAITNGKIEFCNVSFSYKRSQLLLDKINLQINPAGTACPME